MKPEEVSDFWAEEIEGNPLVPPSEQDTMDAMGILFQFRIFFNNLQKKSGGDYETAIAAHGEAPLGTLVIMLQNGEASWEKYPQHYAALASLIKKRLKKKQR